MTLTRPILFDVTRLISTGWVKRHPTGIDRVCDAYLSHYKKNAHAVIQHKGAFRVLSEKHSDKLFALLADRAGGFRYKLAKLLPSIMAADRAIVRGGGRKYLNVGHTDFDLSSHQRWVKRCDLKPIYMIHDLIPINAQPYCLPHATKRHKGRVISSLNNAAGIIVNSNATASELNDFAAHQKLNIPPIIAAHLGVEDFGCAVDISEQSKPHFVCIGTIEPRKNHLMLLRVWKKLISQMQDKTPQLIIIGRWGRQSKPVRDMLSSDLRLSKHVTMLDNCNDTDMLEWTQSAKAVLLPSLAEGYGLPLIEAMAMQTPVIASDLPCFREIGKNVPLLLSPHDEAAWKDAIIALFTQDKELKRQKRLLQNFSAPKWAHHFVKIDRWLEQLDNEEFLGNAKHFSMLQHASNNHSLVPEGVGHSEGLSDEKVSSL